MNIPIINAMTIFTLPKVQPQIYVSLSSHKLSAVKRRYQRMAKNGKVRDVLRNF